MTPRPSWDEYFISLVDAAAARASCDRGRSGAVFVRDNDVLSTGYVGAPPGLPDCYQAGHLMETHMVPNPQVGNMEFSHEHCVRTIHAEQNGIIRAARNGVSLRGATVYCTMEPCRNCAMSLIALGVKRVVAKNVYHAAGHTKLLLTEADISLEVLSDEQLYDAKSVLSRALDDTKAHLPQGMTIGKQCAGLTKCVAFAGTGYSHTEACCLVD